MARILAHRGNINGPSLLQENQLATIRRALAHGWGLEIDIRRTPDGRFYIAHDAVADPEGLAAEAYFAELRRHPHAVVALNIKEEGYERDLVVLLEQEHVLRQVFLFDMELIEAEAGGMAHRFRDANPTIRLAARVSDRGESIDRALAIPEASVIWLDEFDRQWAGRADVDRLKAAGKAVYAVSPDLHGFPFERTRSRWLDFLHWGVDGVCTDYAADLAHLSDRQAALERHIA